MAEGGPRGVSAIVCSGLYERVHFALVLASAAAAIGAPATLLFTGAALTALRQPDGDGAPGWHDLATESGSSPATIDAGYSALGVAALEELLAACTQFGVRFIVCEMGLRIAGLTMGDLRSDIEPECAGVVTLLAESGAERSLLFL